MNNNLENNRLEDEQSKDKQSGNDHLEICNLNKTFTVHVSGGKQIMGFEDVSFNVKRGEFLAIIGGSGSGKSSLLKCIYRTYIPDSGSILYRLGLERTPTDLIAAPDHTILALRRSEIGYVSQLLYAIPRVTALDVIAEPLLARGMDVGDARDVASTYLARLRLPKDLWDAYPSTFSGGERQRVNIARALIASANLLLLDEPTSALDPESTAVVVNMLREVKGKTTMIGIFHDLSVVREVADRVIVMKNNRMVGTKTPGDIPGSGTGD
ncbi:MAG: ATP-binding cassette domain-containing protein [ANME-2 cluster archaeon]|nr:ATP-binding cassette domain-containing protein [ANME-2 cluster archaeon]